MRNLLLTSLSIILILSVSESKAQYQQVLQETNRQELFSLSSKWTVERADKYEKGKLIVLDRGEELRTVSSNGEIIELQGVDENGRLNYYTTENKDAARTISTNKVWPGGAVGVSLKGDSMTAGEWDGGAVRSSHQELTGRVTQVDSSTSIGDHPTHVAGTIIASGVDSSAQGMAYNANLDAYDWTNDDAEMAAAAANGLLLSNHSYGNITGWRYNSSFSRWEWWGDTTLSGSTDYKFGFYNSQSAAWDQIARNAPYYLIVKSAGNDRGDVGTNPHYLALHGTWSSTSRLADGGTSGYDCISTYSGSKNILTIGAVDAIPGGYSGPSSVVMSSFSGWGPTDDGRIKPDLVTNGVGVYSSVATSDTSYASWPGTSMATPGATGSLLLVQEHYKNENASFMKAATLKALAIHTSDEAGSNPGPDYVYGWGLMNTAAAVEHISDTSGNKDITETSISNGGTYSFTLTASGFSPIKATICWTDMPGTPTSATLNPSTLMLVNDLDIRIIRNSDSTIFYPYKLNPASPSSAATTGDNNRDNVEQIYLANPTAGSYTVVVSHKSTLSGGSSQDFSLVLDGGNVPIQPLNCTGVIAAPAYWNFDTLANCSGVSGSACPLPSWYGWQNDTLDNIDWTVRNGTTTSSGTGPSTDYNTGTTIGKYLYTEASASGTGFPNKQAILYSPCISLDTMNNSELTFAYHMYGSAMGSLSVEVYNGYAWNQIWTASGQQSTDWLITAVDISDYDGDTIMFRFIGITGSNYQSDMAIDAVSIHEKMPCLESTNLNIYNVTDSSANFSWTSDALFWNIRLDIQDSVTVIPVTTINFKSVLFFNLLPNTTYDIYLQDSCVSGDTSAWLGPISFTTVGTITNPSPCGMAMSIAELGCASMLSYPISVNAPGTTMGTDVFLNEVRLIIEHTWDGDLAIGLRSPNGDTVGLSVFNGSSGDNYGNPYDTTCSQVTSFRRKLSPSISSGAAPFIGSFLPQMPLSNFDNGSNPNGLWSLLICDDFVADSGFLHHVELVFDTVPDSTTCIFQQVQVNGDSSICPGDSVQLSSTLGDYTDSNYTYQWYKDGQAITGQTSESIFANSMGKYNLLVTDSNSCSDSASIATVISIHNLPIVTISNLGNDTLCLGDSTILQSSSGVTYAWYKNGSPWGVNTTYQQVVYDSGFYNVIVTDSNNCQDSSIVSTQIWNSGYPNVSISNNGNSSICENGQTVLIASGALNYQWFNNGISINGANLDSLIVTDSGSYNALGINAAGCSDSSNLPIDISVNPSPVVTITSLMSSSFCDGDSTILSSSFGVSYQWYNDGQVMVGSTTKDIVVKSPGSFNVMVSNSNMCSDSSSSAALITVNSLPNVAITNSGPSTFCSGDTVVLTTSGGASYQWYNNGQVISGEISSSLVVNSQGSFNVIVTDTNTCSDSSTNSHAINVNSLPVVSIIHTGSASFCSGGSTSLSTIPGVSYQWYLGGLSIPGANSSTHLTSDSGLYNVFVTDSNNCSDSSASPLLITVFPLPLVDISIIGDSVFCQDDSVILVAPASMNQYQWYQNGLLMPGQNNPDFVAKSAGYYNVLVTDANTCSDSSLRAKRIIVNPLPFIGILYSDTILCSGDSANLIAPTGLIYQWYKNGSVLSGENKMTLIVNTAGSYNVLGTNSSFCSDTAESPINIHVLDLPIVTIDPFEDMCERDNKKPLQTGLPVGGTYSGIGVSGNSTNGYFFDPGVSGTGTIDITYTYTDPKSCTNLATETQLVKNCVGIEENSGEFNVVFYPNPTNGLLHISTPPELEGKAAVMVFDAKGQLIRFEEINEIEKIERIKVDMSHEANGVYYVHLQLEKQSWKQKIILEKNL